VNNIVYISLGTNMGEKYDNLVSAIKLLKNNEHIKLAATSSIYETDPVGYLEQDHFLNMVIKVKTELEPLELLGVCAGIEEKLGRKREIRWGPRTIDLDILLFNQENIKTEKLIVPHPRMMERAFVIIPLLELSPDIKALETGQPLQDSLKDIPDREGVRIWKMKDGEDVFALFES
jgi:2-amino-4-hydroxy-6-hydroxymethyldihydropteridine diphosphokinase